MPTARWTAGICAAARMLSSPRWPRPGCARAAAWRSRCDPARALIPAVVAAWEIGATVVLVPPALGAAELAAVAQGLGACTAPDHGGRAALASRARPAAPRPRLGVDMLPPLALIVRARASAGCRPRGRCAREALVRLDRAAQGGRADARERRCRGRQRRRSARAGPGRSRRRARAADPLLRLRPRACWRCSRAVPPSSSARPFRRAARSPTWQTRRSISACLRSTAWSPRRPSRRRPTSSAARYLLSCTAPLSPELIRSFATRFGAAVCQHYGSSETGAVANHVPEEVLERPESVGRAIGGVEVHVAEDTGELVVRGPRGRGRLRPRRPGGRHAARRRELPHGRSGRDRRRRLHPHPAVAATP